MKTTIHISDDLLARARVVVQREGTTLRALVEAGLERVLRERMDPIRMPIEPVIFGGDGLVNDLEGAPWAAVRDRVYGLET